MTVKNIKYVKYRTKERGAWSVWKLLVEYIEPWNPRDSETEELKTHARARERETTHT